MFCYLKAGETLKFQPSSMNILKFYCFLVSSCSKYKTFTCNRLKNTRRNSFIFLAFIHVLKIYFDLQA